MSTSRQDRLPAAWDDARDVPFFRITSSLFPPAFCLGASGLLATYDDDAAPAARPIVPAQGGARVPSRA